MGIDCVEELLQFLSCQDSVREVGFEFIEGEFSIVWRQRTNKSTKMSGRSRCTETSSRKEDTFILMHFQTLDSSDILSNFLIS